MRHRPLPPGSTRRVHHVLCVALLIVVAATCDLIGPLLVAASALPACFSPTPLENAGNGTGILLLSALASLSLVRDSRSRAGALSVGLLGLLAGLGL